jgi:Tfp pilus assembly protein PilF
MKPFTQTFAREHLLRLVLTIALIGVALNASAFLGLGRKSSEDTIAQAARRAGELSREAELAWGADNNPKRAIELYQQAIDICLETEEANPKGELGSVRFYRAFCETQIDRVKFDSATSSQRNVAVMVKPRPPTTSPQATSYPDSPERATPITPSTATPITPSTATPITPATASPAPPAPPLKTAPALSAADITEEVEWARDMIEGDGDDEARQSLLKVLRTDPVHADARLLLATLECKAGEFKEALLILEDLEQEHPSTTTYLLLSGAYLGTGEPYRAMLALDKLLALNPTHPDALINMAYLTMELSGKASEAAMYYRQALKCGAAPDTALARRLGL